MGTTMERRADQLENISSSCIENEADNSELVVLVKNEWSLHSSRCHQTAQNSEVVLGDLSIFWGGTRYEKFEELCFRSMSFTYEIFLYTQLNKK